MHYSISCAPNALLLVFSAKAPETFPYNPYAKTTGGRESKPFQGTEGRFPSGLIIIIAELDAGGWDRLDSTIHYIPHGPGAVNTNPIIGVQMILPDVDIYRNLMK
jgi:hypothetical protein